MRLTRGESLTAGAAGIAFNLFAVVVGFIVPLAHPARDEADNALLTLGVIGLLNAGLMWKAGLLADERGVRPVFVAYAVTSALAVWLADFGGKRELGWVVKAASLVALGVVIRSLRGSRTG